MHRVWIIPPAFLPQQNRRFEIERELREREGEFSFPIQDRRRRLVSPLSGLSAAFSPTFHSSYAKPLLQVDRGRRKEKREEPERRNGHCKDAATWTDRTQVSQRERGRGAHMPPSGRTGQRRGGNLAWQGAAGGRRTADGHRTTLKRAAAAASCEQRSQAAPVGEASGRGERALWLTYFLPSLSLS